MIGSHKQMETMLDDIMRGVLTYLADPHPRVRYAACNAIGQMSTDFAPGILLGVTMFSSRLLNNFFFK